MIQVTCPVCSKRGRVPDEAAGRSVRCSKCAAEMRVPFDNAREYPVAAAPIISPRVAATATYRPTSSAPKRSKIRFVIGAIIFVALAGLSAASFLVPGILGRGKETKQVANTLPVRRINSKFNDLYTKADKAYTSLDADLAMSYADSALLAAETDREKASVIALMAYCCSIKGHHSTAADYWTMAIRLEPEDFGHRLARCKCRFQVAKERSLDTVRLWIQVVDDSQDLVRRNDKCAEAWMMLGEAQWCIFQKDAAEQAIRKSLSLDPSRESKLKAHDLFPDAFPLP
jgi:tetratricopeptide (TPR) repeat protein